MTLKMTSAQVLKMPVTSHPFQNYSHPDDQLYELQLTIAFVIYVKKANPPKEAEIVISVLLISTIALHLVQ